MTKNELIENLKKYEAQTMAYSKRMTVFASLAMALGFLILWLRPYEEVIGSYGMFTVFILIFLALFTVISMRHEKAMDKYNSSRCRNCNKPFEGSQELAIAVLENKCQRCGGAIYDT